MTTEEQLILDLLNGNYKNITYTSRLDDMFSKHYEALNAYIKPGREFWYYDGTRYRKLKVTYVRSGVMFFTFIDEPDTELAWFIGSFNCASLYAAQIYPYEIGELLAPWYKDVAKDFPEICKQCKWDDCNGMIKVEVIWE